MLKIRMNLRHVIKTVASLAENKVISRGDFFRIVWFCLFSASIMLSLAACSSPESDGIKAAKMMYSSQKEYTQKRNLIIKEQNKAYETYVKKFDSYSFETRIEAREKLNEYIEKAKESSQKLEEDSQELMNKAYEYRNKLASKYQTNRENEEKFSYAFNNYRPKVISYEASQDAYTDYHSIIRDLIKTIIPPKPDIERLKNDLIGRRVTNQTTGYYNWIIDSLDELKGLELISTTDNGKEVLFEAQLRLQRINQWDTNISVKYVLPDNEDWWKLETYNGQMDIVHTGGKYDSCIKTQWTGQGGFGIPARHIEFTNGCNVNLIITGELVRHSGFTGTSKNRFNINVPANAKATLNHTTINSSQVLYVVSFEIDFVEQSEL